MNFCYSITILLRTTLAFIKKMHEGASAIKKYIFFIAPPKYILVACHEGCAIFFL